MLFKNIYSWKNWLVWEGFEGVNPRCFEMERAEE